jgi:hypothetical protein
VLILTAQGFIDPKRPKYQVDNLSRGGLYCPDPGLLQYGAISIGTWSVRTHCIQSTTIHTEISKRSDWLMSTDPVPILMAPYCTLGKSRSRGKRRFGDDFPNADF